MSEPTALHAKRESGAAERERDQARERIAELEALLRDNAATRALDEIAALCGCAHWDYPAQVVRDVQELARKLAAVRLAVAGAPEPTTHAAVRAALKEPE